MEDVRCDTTVVGAGPAGLAVAGCLTQAGRSFELLEQQPNVGSAWRNHYDRLHLHTPRVHSGLPHFAMPEAYPTYASRQQVVDYLQSYAEHFKLNPRFGTTVTAVEKDGAGWKVTSSAGVFRSNAVVMCTGYNRIPKKAEWPGLEGFSGEVVHSSKYKNGEPWRGKRALVVGAGNSGAEIALDLLEHGATPSICIRGPLNVMSRDIGPLPAVSLAVAVDGAPLWLKDTFTRLGSRLTFGDLSPWGIVPTADGPVSHILKAGRIPLIDIGTIAAIKKGQIKVIPGIERFTPTGVTCVDGQAHFFDAVVLATGFQTGLERLLVGVGDVLNDHGLPRAVPEVAEARGLYFVGFENPTTGLLRQIGLRALDVAALITAKA